MNGFEGPDANLPVFTTLERERRQPRLSAALLTASPAEGVAAVDGHYAYFGTWTVDPSGSTGYALPPVIVVSRRARSGGRSLEVTSLTVVAKAREMEEAHERRLVHRHTRRERTRYNHEQGLFHAACCREICRYSPGPCQHPVPFGVGPCWRPASISFDAAMTPVGPLGASLRPPDAVRCLSCGEDHGGCWPQKLLPY